MVIGEDRNCTYKGHADQHYGSVTYSQHGEDLLVLNLGALMGLSAGEITYLDLGAHHHENISNTKLLYDRGACGVNVEANPFLVADLQLNRPRDLVVNIGVGVKEGKFNFLMYDDQSGRNTFSSAEVERLQRLKLIPEAPSKSIEMDVLTLNQIVDFHCYGRFPRFLFCDIEGLDLEVMQSVDFSCSFPYIICVETRRCDTAHMAAVVEPKGFFLYARCGENLIFVQDEFKNKVY
jgi:FkbM family methyltransferase